MKLFNLHKLNIYTYIYIYIWFESELHYKRQEAETITDTDNIVFLANTPTQAESLQHSLEQAASSIGRHVNGDKMEYMCFNQEDGGSLK